MRPRIYYKEKTRTNHTNIYWYPIHSPTKQTHARAWDWSEERFKDWRR